jgi:hypothetical protein
MIDSDMEVKNKVASRRKFGSKGLEKIAMGFGRSSVMRSLVYGF